MKAKRVITIAAILLLATTLQVWGQDAPAAEKVRKNMTREEYIEHYAPLAVEQQTLFGIPASITLAQAVFESNNGNSVLAQASNNHFGIKCSNSWNGPGYRHDDDAPQECFRVYNTVEESYIDHSLILLERPWYQKLFTLDIKDYKGWAHGLREAGYATNPQYAYRLIEIIEKYELYKYDNALLADYQPSNSVPAGEVTTTEIAEAEASEEEEQEDEQEEIASVEEPAQEQKPTKVDIDNFGTATQTLAGYGIYSEEGRRYVIASEGDHLSQVADAVGVSERSLRLINNLQVNHTIAAGEKIFIEK